MTENVIVATRMKDGKIAHFDMGPVNLQQAFNGIRNGLAAENEWYENMPFVARVPGCGRDLKPSLMAHRVSVPAVGKDPLQGALDQVVSRIVSDDELPENQT